MVRIRSSLRLGLAVPVALALTASLGFLPASASAAPRARSAAQAEDADPVAYIVNTATDPRTIAEVKQAITAAGGTVFTAYDKIGVIVAHSAAPDFGARLRAVPGVRSAGATAGTPLNAASADDAGAVRHLSASEAARIAKASDRGAEPLEAEQWDLRAVKADKAAKINQGSGNVTVAVIDGGVDDTHPDLAANFSPSQSASCVSGKPDTTYGSWRPAKPEYAHGTHVAGTIAAARNGVGVAGVAPGVRVAGITISQPSGRQLMYAESVVCAFVFAADHGVQITNNSYYVDPWQFNCLDNPDQKAIIDAVDRAQRYATRKGTLNVAAAGNSRDDLTAIPGNCVQLPAQLPGVVTVSGTSATNSKAYYSNYGLGVIDVAAPGGDMYVPSDTPSGEGGVLSTVPGGEYGYEQGTSMASPHASGVAALLKSAHPRATPAELRDMLKAQADNPGCPDEPYDWNGDGVVDAVCAGDRQVNGFYGFGVVDALSAVE
ncbi:S8 family serine peptidase [Streptomyces sp. NPDC048717]|uniref:S8 family peptidase n=1 Tax=Streptomyces sp. NPDC048717 TaxID=3154928 RepID=UPI0034492437